MRIYGRALGTIACVAVAATIIAGYAVESTPGPVPGGRTAPPPRADTSAPAPSVARIDSAQAERLKRIMVPLRQEEYAADKHGAELLKRTGKSKQLMIDTLTWLTQASGPDSGGFFATHPDTEDWIDALRKASVAG